MHRTRIMLMTALGVFARWRLPAAICISALPLITPAVAVAQEQPRVSVAISNQNVELGDTVIFQVTVDGASEAQQPDFPQSDGYAAEFRGAHDESRRTSFIINGRASESNVLRYVMQWQLTPTREGKISVEPFSVNAAGKTLTVPRTTFSVARPQTNPNFTLQFICDRTDAYEGEPIRAKLVWTLGANVKSATFTGPDGGKAFDIEPVDPRPAARRGTPVQNNDPWRLVPFLGGEAVVSRSQGDFNGREVPIFTLDVVITPRAKGPISIGPYRVACDEVTGQKARSFFDSPFDDLSQTRRAIVESNSIALEVKPVPEEGKPAEFSGLIGRFSIEATSPQTQANVGDPVPLSVTIKGPEPQSAIKAPDLDAQVDFASLFKAAPEGWEAATASDPQGGRAFTTTVRPKSDTITQIPPIKLAYFDTSTGKYAVATSKPLALKVKASRQVTAADAVGGSGAIAPIPVAASPLTLTNAPAGVGANHQGLDALDDRQLSLLGFVRSPLGMLFMGLPPASLLASMVVAYRRTHRSPVQAARKLAIAKARGLLAIATDQREVSIAVRTALEPWVGVDRDAITQRDATRLPDACGSMARDVLTLLESAAYDRRALDVGLARSAATQLLDQLSRQRTS
ncbi:MAG: BatD family protein [Planctomycetota bacterium]|nr:BatD family protein [Planctomycetota bacterium]